MVTTEGIAGLSVRRIAQAAQTSTTAVYSLFGGKEELQRGVIVRAFSSFAQSQESIPATDDPVTDAAGLGVMYLQWALDNPRLYQVMFGQELAGVAPSAEVDQASARAIAPLTDAVRRAIDTGAFRAEHPATIVASLWSTVHGLTELLLTGRLPDGADPAKAAMATLDGWRTSDQRRS
ncbi:TetR/AcrR family transcriptional regulator [Gordonia sinesedis]